jgi:ATP-dependent Clp protease adaptor protein ClpS
MVEPTFGRVRFVGTVAGEVARLPIQFSTILQSHGDHQVPHSAAAHPTPILEPEMATRSRLLPPYNVILENDDDHSMDFVVDVLRKVFGFELEKSFQLMMTAHDTGRVVVWTGPKEVAELKAEQMTTFHETRERDNKDLGPLGVLIEPAE